MPVDSDGDGLPDEVDNCPAVFNPGQQDADAEGTGDHCDQGDSDLDGYTDSNEARFIGTRADYACYVDWPSNLFNEEGSFNRLTIQDLTSFLAPERRLNTSPADDAYSPRWDLVPGSGALPDAINIQDLTALLAGDTGYPPMFENSAAFNKTCIY